MSELKLLEVGTIVYNYANGPMTVINSYCEDNIDKTAMFEVKYKYCGKQYTSYFEYDSLGKYIFEEKDIDMIGCEEQSERFTPDYTKMNKYFISEECTALIEKAMRAKGKTTNHNEQCILMSINFCHKKKVIYKGNGLECFKKYTEIMNKPSLRNYYDCLYITTEYEENNRKYVNIYKV